MTDAAKIAELRETATKLAEVAEQKLQAWRDANDATKAAWAVESEARAALKAAETQTGEARARERTASIAADRAGHKVEAARVAVEKAVRAAASATLGDRIDASRCVECGEPQLYGAKHTNRCTIGGAVLCPECRSPAPFHVGECSICLVLPCATEGAA